VDWTAATSVRYIGDQYIKKTFLVVHRMLKNYQEMRVFFGLYYAFLSATALYLD
jgi:hypothetical protein